MLENSRALGCLRTLFRKNVHNDLQPDDSCSIRDTRLSTIPRSRNNESWSTLKVKTPVPVKDRPRNGETVAKQRFSAGFLLQWSVSTAVCDRKEAEKSTVPSRNASDRFFPSFVTLGTLALYVPCQRIPWTCWWSTTNTGSPFAARTGCGSSPPADTCSCNPTASRTSGAAKQEVTVKVHSRLFRTNALAIVSRRLAIGTLAGIGVNILGNVLAKGDFALSPIDCSTFQELISLIGSFVSLKIECWKSLIRQAERNAYKMLQTENVTHCLANIFRFFYSIRMLNSH